jgi:hypothetical protein
VSSPAGEDRSRGGNAKGTSAAMTAPVIETPTDHQRLNDWVREVA